MASLKYNCETNDQNVLVTKISQLKMTEMFQRKKQFATTTPEPITQIKKQRTHQILEQKNVMVETLKATELISECEAIQTRLKKSVKTKKQSDRKAFCRQMLQGQVKNALWVMQMTLMENMTSLQTQGYLELRDRKRRCTQFLRRCTQYRFDSQCNLLFSTEVMFT